MKNITDAEFQAEVLEESDIPVLVDFWASWCGPCKTIAPHLESLAKEFEGRLKIVKVNIEESRSFAAEYKVRSIPTILAFSNGEVVDKLVGSPPSAKVVLKGFAERLLS